MSQPKNPWLSIITACLNDGKNLKKTIQSIRDQQADFIEYIIVDGKSNDDTLNIIEENKQIIQAWLSEKDEGVYDAMNKGLKMVNGQYILFMNAGDTFYNTSVLRNIKEQQRDEDVLYGNAIFVHEDGKYKSPRHKILPSNLDWKSFKNGMVVCHQALLIKKTIVASYNLKYKVAADLDWAIRSVKNASRIRNLKFIICNFQFGGMSDIQKKKALQERWHILIDHYGLITTLWCHLKIPFTYTGWKIYSLYKKYTIKQQLYLV